MATYHQKFLTKYELSRILGIRSNQINMGAPPMIDVSSDMAPLHISALELKHGKLDVVIDRPLPGNLSYQVHIGELHVPEELNYYLHSMGHR